MTRLREIAPLTTTVLQIRASSSCSRGCGFCATPSSPSARDLTLSEVRDNIRFFVTRRGVDELVFSGGEVTDRDDFPELMRLVMRWRHRLRLVTIITSGQDWSEATLRACVGAVDRVVVSLTPRSEHDLSERCAFTGQAIRTVERLRDAGVSVQTNTVILPENLTLLRRVAELTVRLEVAAPTFTFPFPQGKIRHDIGRSVAPWSRVAPFLFEAIDIAEPRSPRIKNLPLCYLGSYQRFCARTTQRILIQRGRQLDDHAVIPPFAGLGLFPPCEGCHLKARCDGFWSEYLACEGFPKIGYDGSYAAPSEGAGGAATSHSPQM